MRADIKEFLTSAYEDDMKRIQELESYEEEALASLSEYQLLIGTAINNITSLNERIGELTEKANLLASVEEQLTKSTQGLNEVNDLISSKSNEIRTLENKIEEMSKLAEAETRKAEAAYAGKVSEIEKASDKLKKLDSELTTREKNINQKEVDLTIVEKRWYKLYESRGAAFKV